MKPYFLVNDIIEVMNLTPYQQWEFGEFQVKLRIIGLRFRIFKVSKYHDGTYRYYVIGETDRYIAGDRKIEVGFEKEQIMLYKRPFINWIKKIFV